MRPQGARGEISGETPRWARRGEDGHSTRDLTQTKMLKFLCRQCARQETLGLVAILGDSLVDHFLVVFVVYVHGLRYGSNLKAANIASVARNEITSSLYEYAEYHFSES